MAEVQGYARFATALGSCGIAWSGKGIAGTWLPEATAAKLAARYPAAVEAAMPSAVAETAELIRRLMTGEAIDLTGAELDMDGVPELSRRIYGLTRAIPAGRTKSYGDIARALGDLGLSRAVGQAMGRNPFPVIVPCHRVLASGGRTGGFSAPGGVSTKFRLLAIEQAAGPEESPLFGALPLAVKPRS